MPGDRTRIGHERRRPTPRPRVAGRRRRGVLLDPRARVVLAHLGPGRAAARPARAPRRRLRPARPRPLLQALVRATGSTQTTADARRRDPRHAAAAADRRRPLVGRERRARARGPPAPTGRGGGAAGRRLPLDARTLRLEDREADARAARVRRDHGRGVPRRGSTATSGGRSRSPPSSTRSSSRSSGWTARGGSGRVCRARTTSGSCGRCGRRTRSGCCDASASRRSSWPPDRVRAARPRRGSREDKADAARRARTIGATGVASSGSRGSTTSRCSAPRRSPGGSRGSRTRPPAFCARARRMVGWPSSC